MEKVKILEVAFKTLSAERTWPLDEPFLKAEVFLSVSSGEPQTVEKDVKEAGFTRRIRYDPNVAKMKFGGRVAFKASPTAVDEIRREERNVYDAVTTAIEVLSTIQAVKSL